MDPEESSPRPHPHQCHFGSRPRRIRQVGPALDEKKSSPFRYAEPSATAIKLIGFPGELFMNMLKAMILPLIAASLISGTARRWGKTRRLFFFTGLSQLDGKTSGKMGSRALLYYAMTTLHAVIVSVSYFYQI